MAEDPTHAVRLGKRFFRATEWAAERHAARGRGARPTTPSLGQVLGIASLVLEDGGTEREAMAAMVLDAIGPDDLPLDELRSRFGKKLARLVARCVEHRPDLAAAGDDEDEAVLRVHAADLLRELRGLLADLRRHGSIAFARFAAPPADQLDHYRELLGVFSRRLPRSHLTQELRAAVGETARLAELDTATAAWRVAHVDAA